MIVLTRAAIRSTAEAFWTKAGGRGNYGSPVRLDEAVMRSLPIAIHRISGLTTGHVESILGNIGASFSSYGPARSLRGCVIADVGVGLILVDGDDPEAEQRLTVSHETAHFLLHYLALRNAAVAGLGSRVVSVLDRTRAPTQAELFSSALRDLPLTPFRHAMIRGTARPQGRIATIEAEADDLAIELLAPWNLVRSLESPDPRSVALRFGLPAPVAARLAAMAVGSTTEIGVTGLFGIR